MSSAVASPELPCWPVMSRPCLPSSWLVSARREAAGLLEHPAAPVVFAP